MPPGEHSQSPPVYGQAPPLWPRITTLHCRYGCRAVVASASPELAVAAMDGHYADLHPVQTEVAA